MTNFGRRNDDRLERFIDDRITRSEERIMSTIADLAAADAEMGTQVQSIVSDVEKLLSLVSSAPPAGLSSEDQALLDSTVASLNTQVQALKAEDAAVNPAPPPPA